VIDLGPSSHVDTTALERLATELVSLHARGVQVLAAGAASAVLQRQASGRIVSAPELCYPDLALAMEATRTSLSMDASAVGLASELRRPPALVTAG